MAKKTLIAKHRIAMPKANARVKEITYVEPGTKFQIEEDEAKRLISLGAAEEADAAEKKAAKKTTAKPAAKATTDAKKDDDSGDGGDLV